MDNKPIQAELVGQGTQAFGKENLLQFNMNLSAVFQFAKDRYRFLSQGVGQKAAKSARLKSNRFLRVHETRNKDHFAG